MKKMLVKMIYVREKEMDEIRRLVEGVYEPLFYSKDWSRDYYEQVLAEAEIILGEPKATDLKYCKKLKLMQITWSGVDYYVNSGCFPQGAVLCSMTGEYGKILSDYAVGMIHALCFTFPHYVRNMDIKKWHRDNYCKSLEDCSVLIVGAGDIGRNVAEKLRLSVKEIVGVRRTAGELGGPFDSTYTMDKLEELLPKADVVVLSLPGTGSTEGMFDEKMLRLMKKDAILVNVGRGTVLKLDDLNKVMAEGLLWGAGIDVSNPEPLPPEHPLWEQERFFITPHIAGNAYQIDGGTDRRIKARCYRNISNFIEGRPLLAVADFQTGYKKH